MNFIQETSPCVATSKSVKFTFKKRKKAKIHKIVSITAQKAFVVDDSKWYYLTLKKRETNFLKINLRNRGTTLKIYFCAFLN